MGIGTSEPRPMRLNASLTAQSLAAFEDGVTFWCQRWAAENKTPGHLPAFEDVALGSIGIHAACLAVLEGADGHWRVLQASPRFEIWLKGSGSREAGPRPDGWRSVTEMSRAAMAAGEPVQRRVSGIHGDQIETSDVLALPLTTRWRSNLVVLYVGPVVASHNVTETVYRSTREGFLLLAPLRGDGGETLDFQIVSANPGASSLLGCGDDALLWGRCSALLRETDRSRTLQTLDRVLMTGQTQHVELNFSSETREMHVRGSIAALDHLVVLTLTDITELTAREAGFRLMFDSNPVPMVLVDTETLRFMDVNTAALQHYGYTRDCFIGMPHEDILHPDEHAALRNVEADRARSYEGERVWRHLRADGLELAIRPYARRLTLRRRPAALVAFFDVTESRRAEAELQSTKVFLDTIIENIPSALLVEDADDNRLLLINMAGEQMLGLRRAEALGRPADGPLSAALTASHSAMASSDTRPGAPEEMPFVTLGDETRTLSVRKLTVPHHADTSPYLLTIADDVTERRAFEAKIAHMAHHDPLTDLPNRALFADQLKVALTRAQRQNTTAAVLGIDLDGFKGVNDSLGHAAGDELLKQVAARLTASLRLGDTAARLGGDEFAVLQDAPASMESASGLADRLVTALAKPFVVADHEVKVGASIGIALAPADGHDSETLLRNADLALYRAKEEGKGTFRFFEPDMNTRLQARRELERDLRAALEFGEFELHYQPLIELDRSGICSCEALLRWRHPQKGYIPPNDFIPLAEETGLIVPIGEWVLRQACDEAITWPNDIKVAVNVSPVQFRDPNLVGTVVSALASSRLAPERLEIEITESVLLANTESHMAVLHKLRAFGVKIAMDDFGTGYSSLSYLSTFPFDKIKIDQSFVRDVESSRHCKAIVNAVAELGHHLGITTVAEGVETSAQMDHLRRQKCKQAQGYLFSRPIPATKLRALLNDAPAHEHAA